MSEPQEGATEVPNTEQKAECMEKYKHYWQWIWKDRER